MTRLGRIIATPFLIIAGIILCPVALAYAVGATFMWLGEWWKSRHAPTEAAVRHGGATEPPARVGGTAGSGPEALRGAEG